MEIGFCASNVTVKLTTRRVGARCEAQKRPRSGHIKNKYRARFEEGNGILYVRDFLRDSERDSVVKELATLKGRARSEVNSLAVERTGVQLSIRDGIGSVFGSAMVLTKLQTMLAEPGLVLGDFPVEARFYSTGAEMFWHSDDQLYAVPQIEVVYTVMNESDSYTEWIDAQGLLQSVWTEPNSALLVKAGAAKHRVTKLRRGSRSIIKAVYTTTLKRSDAFTRCSRSFSRRK
mmetsp:Transcript_8824/g.26518  ORF Transcript_8824/g.26518 Transcript_8824/m.26518 type:complete len:232 (+) Transcript_8824:305-1000(+)